MANTLVDGIAGTLGVSAEIAMIILLVIAVWSIIWKGLALWKSARKTHLTWFIVLLIFNTIGILEILYIYVFSELGKKSKTKEKSKEKEDKKK